MSPAPQARVLYKDATGHEFWYILQPGESHDPATGLINPGGRTVQQAAEQLAEEQSESHIDHKEGVTESQKAHGVLKIEQRGAPTNEKIVVNPFHHEGAADGAGVVTDTHPKADTPAEQPQPTPIKANLSVGQLSVVLQEAEAKVGAIGKMVISQLRHYIDEMLPRKPQTAQTMSRNQVALYRTLTMAINKVEEDFPIVWKAILGVFHEQKDGVFHETAVFRGMEHVALPPDDRKALQRILNLIKVTADPQKRKVSLRQVDMTRTLEFGVTEHGRSKLLAFYGI